MNIIIWILFEKYSVDAIHMKVYFKMKQNLDESIESYATKKPKNYINIDSFVYESVFR